MDQNKALATTNNNDSLPRSGLDKNKRNFWKQFESKYDFLRYISLKQTLVETYCGTNEMSKENAILFYEMLRREGFLNSTKNGNFCVQCAVDKLEKKIIIEIARHIQMTHLANKYYRRHLREDNFYTLCMQHRPYDPANHRVPTAKDNKDFDIWKSTPVEPYNTDYDSERKETLSETVALNFNWVYFYENIMPERKRMPYTKSFNSAHQDITNENKSE